jgi:S1-C subfamily serine protease
MVRALVIATIFFVIPRAASAQPLSVLHIKVVLVDADRKATPVPRHALLVSDNPATAPPRRIVTALDGTVDVRLRPGNYTVESDQAVVFQGKAYLWTQTLDIAAGRDAALELTAANAEVEPVTATTASAAQTEADPSALLMQWQDSVVAIWTPTTHASGFVIDANGLIATNQRLIGTATSVEVQLTPAIKVAGSVLVADPVRDVAVLRIDPQALASVRPVPLGCALPAKPSLVAGQRIFAIGAPLREQKALAYGTVSRVDAKAVATDFILPGGSAGGPIFAADSRVAGITSVVEMKDEGRRGDSRFVGVDDVCGVVADAEKKMKDAAPPNGRHLPVEPVRPYPVDALKDAVQRRAGSLNPYQMSSSDFDIAFITPVLAYGAQYPPEGSRSTRASLDQQALARPLMDFANWAGYVADFPPVLMVRVTPKLVESFWTTVARGAAQTQGVALPARKHVKSGFSRMRVFCGDEEVTPIHPFTLELRVSENDAVYEGFYVFDPDALGPQCGTVKVALYSAKEPEKEDSRVVDPGVLQKIWQDFTPYRALK